mmetsp:Transcript_3682/g.8199  ORF Transcript_3682/g.8199 Transcript_3682/m.8199 type:complete len:294 (-) Transcript_3682:351-1232(-)
MGWNSCSSTPPRLPRRRLPARSLPGVHSSCRRLCAVPVRSSSTRTATRCAEGAWATLRPATRWLVTSTQPSRGRCQTAPRHRSTCSSTRRRWRLPGRKVRAALLSSSRRLTRSFAGVESTFRAATSSPLHLRATTSAAACAPTSTVACSEPRRSVSRTWAGRAKASSADRARDPRDAGRLAKSVLPSAFSCMRTARRLTIDTRSRLPACSPRVSARPPVCTARIGSLRTACSRASCLESARRTPPNFTSRWFARRASTSASWRSTRRGRLGSTWKRARVKSTSRRLWRSRRCR